MMIVKLRSSLSADRLLLVEVDSMGGMDRGIGSSLCGMYRSN